MNRAEPGLLETSAGPGTLADIEALLQRSWAAHQHVPAITRLQMEISAAEIAANILEHGAAGRSLMMRVEVLVLAKEVWVEFSDDGAPVSVDLDGVAMPDEMAERGRGLALAKKALARLTYHRETLNHWTLVSHPFA